VRKVALLLALLVAGLVASSPGSATHYIPDNCALNPAPTTYEAPQDRVAYMTAMDLAAFNLIAPNDGFFAVPGLENGPRSGRGTADPYIPPTLLKAISWIESATAHADHTVYWGATGPVKVSFDCGFGIAQVTSGMTDPADNGWPSAQQALVATNFLYNIARGSRILSDKWNYAPEARPIVGNADPTIAENWYYAVWSYNGFASVNNPLNRPGPRSGYSCSPDLNDGYSHDRTNYPYQELVFGCAARPPHAASRQMWSPLAISLPDLNDPAYRDPISNFPSSSRMDIPSPQPTHTDPTARPSEGVRSLMLGSPSLVVSHGAVNQNVNRVTISNGGRGILAWRAKPEQSWIHVDKQAGVALSSDVPCAANQPCERSPTLTISVDTALAPATGEGQVTIDSLTNGQRWTVRVARSRSDHFYTTDPLEPGGATVGGYRAPAAGAYVSAAPRAGWVSLYRLWNPTIGDHFYTTDPAEVWEAARTQGYRYERVEAYVSPKTGSGLTPFHRLWSGSLGNHFYTTNGAEVMVAVAGGYTYEGVEGYTAAAPGAGFAPLYRWWSDALTDHFYTVSASQPAPKANEPDRFLGVAMYVAPGPVAGSAPLYRLWKGAGVWDHFYTTDAAERDAAVAQGYAYEMIAGYISPTQVTGSVALHRLWNRQLGDHFYTTNAAAVMFAVAGGYVYEGIEAYVSATGAPGLVPLYEWWLS